MAVPILRMKILLDLGVRMIDVAENRASSVAPRYPGSWGLRHESMEAYEGTRPSVRGNAG